MKKIILLLLAAPILLGISDYLNMYTFNQTADRIFLIGGASIVFISFVCSAIFAIREIIRRKKKQALLNLCIAIYSFTYLVVILFTYIIPYLEFGY